MLRVAEILLHLDLEPGLKHLLRQVRQQAAGSDKVLAVRSCPFDELLGERPDRPLLAQQPGMGVNRYPSADRRSRIWPSAAIV